MPDRPYQFLYAGCVAFALLLLTVGSARGWLTPSSAPEAVQKDPSVRAGSRRPHYVYFGFGGK